MQASRFGSVFMLLACACSSSSEGNGPPAGSSGVGGMPSVAGAPSTSGAAGSGNGGQAPVSAAGSNSTAGSPGGNGSATGPGGSGGQSAGGQSSGGQSSGGRSSGGQSGAGPSSGGQSTGGQGSGGSSGTRVVKPSPGCSKQSAQVTIANSRIGIPPGYNGKDPVPAVIAFHAAGNDNSSIEGAFKTSDLAKKYLMIYPNSTSATTANRTGWNMQADKSRYLAVKDALLNDACVDENRIYATGHSSGAQFVVALLCSGDGDFDAVAPVASSVSCQKWRNGAIPALVIHGVLDQERKAYGLNDGDGKKDLQPYLTSNSCQMTSTPFDPVLTQCSNVKGVDGKAFDDGCVEFSGCSAKTRWCNHNDPQYGTSNHGIPCFGVRAIYDFFESL